VLPENERAVVELVAVDGLSLKDAAAALGIRPGAARVRMYRARRVVRDALGSSENLTRSRPAVRAVPSEIGESR
jgi:DNA-directed RNA polymerase specialized sigma24 family protein